MLWIQFCLGVLVGGTAAGAVALSCRRRESLRLAGLLGDARAKLSPLIDADRDSDLMLWALAVDGIMTLKVEQDSLLWIGGEVSVYYPGRVPDIPSPPPPPRPRLNHRGTEGTEN